MSKSKSFVIGALAGLFARKEITTFSMDKYGSPPKKEKPLKMSKQKLRKLKGKKTRENRGRKRSKK